jgi:spore coat polysaccharide biosynthesis protein SpsF (cytidylyltransferase family)
MSSTRLPGKTLADIGGEPMLALLLKRLGRAQVVERIAVATSTDAVDDPIAQMAHTLGIGVSRGSRDDVLARFVAAAGKHRGPLVRVTGDCPLIDPRIVDALVEHFLSVPGCAYASNIEPRTFPDGLDVEVFDADALRAVAADALTREQREHVTAALRAQPQRFPQVALVAERDLGALRWTVDEAEVLEFVRAVVLRLGDARYTAGLEQILAAVRREPSLAALYGCRG